MQQMANEGKVWGKWKLKFFKNFFPILLNLFKQIVIFFEVDWGFLEPDGHNGQVFF